MKKRPVLNIEIELKDFEQFYWLKNELIHFCRSEGLNVSGSKSELTERIKIYLKSGKKTRVQKTKVKSDFDWHSEALSAKTKITDSYKNTQNVRRFFIDHIGPHFKFNITFMAWMKSNVGKTLDEASKAWIEIYNEKKKNAGKSEIPKSLEYNTYIRDFIKDNPGSTIKDVIPYWKKKKAAPGNNKYSREDLKK